jgi:hypothetical protein
MIAGLLLTTEAMLAGLPQKNSQHLARPAGMAFSWRQSSMQ